MFLPPEITLYISSPLKRFCSLLLALKTGLLIVSNLEGSKRDILSDIYPGSSLLNEAT